MHSGLWADDSIVPGAVGGLHAVRRHLALRSAGDMHELGGRVMCFVPKRLGGLGVRALGQRDMQRVRSGAGQWRLCVRLLPLGYVL